MAHPKANRHLDKPFAGARLAGQPTRPAVLPMKRAGLEPVPRRVGAHYDAGDRPGMTRAKGAELQTVETSPTPTGFAEGNRTVPGPGKKNVASRHCDEPRFLVSIGTRNDGEKQLKRAA